MKPAFYVCKCRCKVTPRKIKTIDKTIKGKRYRILSCPDHDHLLDGRVIEFIFKCKICGKQFSGNANSFYCSDCEGKANTAYNKKTKKEKKSVKQIDGKKTRVDCPGFGRDNICGTICISDFAHCNILRKYGRDHANR